MDKVGVAGDGVNFAADLLKFVIFVGEVLKFRRADKGKIRRVEEENGPFAEDVGLRYGFKLKIMVGVSL